MCANQESKKKQSRRMLEITKAPELLMVTINRFNLVDKKVKSQNVSMRSFEGFKELGGTEYKLLAFIDHEGEHRATGDYKTCVLVKKKKVICTMYCGLACGCTDSKIIKSMPIRPASS